MTSPYWERYESLVDQQIREAQERGAFDNLPGAGKPLTGLHGRDDEHWWIKGYMQRHGLPTESLLPTPLRLRKEVERLPETVLELSTEQAVREHVAELNTRIVAWLRYPTGPQVVLVPVRVDDVVERWRADRPARRPRARPDEPEVPEVSQRDRARRRLGFLRRRRTGR